MKKNHLFTAVCMFVACTLLSQTTYSFTTAGATGAQGPTQSQINSAYLSTNLNGLVTVSLGIQSWTVPQSGLYSIDAYGAKGGGNYGGQGARVKGEFNLTSGQVLKILVGQQGLYSIPLTSGGGGAFVASNSVALIVAGGGGGASQSGTLQAGAITTNGQFSYGGWPAVGSQTNLPGFSGNAGEGSGGSGGGGGGGGFFTSGNLTLDPSSGYGFLFGGAGGWNGSGLVGGFGGGGGARNNGGSYYGGGAGGGYSGGAGACGTTSVPEIGGGGGSYNSGSNQINTPGINSGDGKIMITRLNGVNITQVAPITCNGASNAILTVSPTIGTAPYTYSWLPGGSTSQTLSGLSAGNYTCITIDATSTSYTNIFTISQPPVISTTISSQTNVTCNGGSNGLISLTASGGTAPYTYSWSPVISSGSIVSGLTAGIYTCTVRDFNNCTVTQTANVTQPNSPSIIAFATSPTVCLGGTTTLIGGGAVSYTWSGGVANGIAFSPTASANYIVTGFDAQGCPGYAQTSIVVNPRPIISAAGGGSVCYGASTSFSASGGNTYTWSTGATGSLVSVSPTIAAIYTVTGSNSFACTNTATLSLSVYSLPTISALLSNTVVCSGSPVTIVGLGANTFTCTGGVTNGFPFYPTSTSVYTISGTDGNGCVNSTTRTVVVNPLPLVAISGTSVICQGYQANLNVNGAVSYTWSNGSTAASISVSPLVTSSYSVTGMDNNGCKNTDATTLVVNPSPTVTATASHSVICSGEALQLFASGANSYTWIPLSLNSSSVTSTPSTTTTYTLEGEANGCLNSSIITVSVNPSPTISLNHSVTTCAFNSVTLNVSGASSYTWSNGSNSASIVVTPSATTVYTVNASANACVKIDSVIVFANPLPVLNVIALNNTICEGDSATLTAIGANSYTWSTTDTLSAIVVHPQTSTSYTVSGINVYGCVSSYSYLMNVTSCTGLIQEEKTTNALLKIYPNPSKGVFTIETLIDSQLTLSNELGQTIKIISRDQINNGTILINNLNAGVYILSGEFEGKTIREKLIITN